MSENVDAHGDEISAEVSLSDSGAKAKVKSRFLSAVDRLLGNVVEKANVPLARSNSRAKALIEADRSIIEAAKNALVRRIETDPEFAERAFENHLDGVFRKRENKEAIVVVARDELRQLPPPDVPMNESMSNTIDEDWLNQFEPIAEKASSSRMRNLFGRILAGVT
jgi:hypothetical protein